MENDLHSIAIPALGTETKNIRPKVFAHIFFGELKKFIRQNNDLSDCRIILHNQDRKTQEAIQEYGNHILGKNGDQSEASEDEDDYPSERQIQKAHIDELQQSLKNDQQEELIKVRTKNDSLKQKVEDLKETNKISSDRITDLEEQLREVAHKYKNSKKQEKAKAKEESKEVDYDPEVINGITEDTPCKKCKQAFKFIDHYCEETEFLDRYCVTCYPKRIKKEILKGEMEEEPEKVTKKTKRTKKSKES